MITQQLINPSSIVVVGGSNDIQKPGGKVLKNLLDGNFQGDLYVVNPKANEIQGVKSYKSVEDLPLVDLAIIAIAAKYTVETVKILAQKKATKAFIILSAGFAEESEQGAKWEKEITDIVNQNGASLIGPNCIGILNTNYNGVFTTPIPKLASDGIDMISGSGATAVFIMESSLPKGLTFNSVWSVGNSAQIGVEDVLEYMDKTFDPQNSSKIKLLYIEKIEKPKKFLKHASSLIRKGCKIAAIKAGSSEAGSRAASSHTGALASSDTAVNGLFEKAGIVRCYGREELATVAAIFQQKELKGNRIAVVTHAGGPGVMLTDALSNGGMQVPPIEKNKADKLLSHLFPGSSVANPIDFLATGTAEQLGKILDFCENEFQNIDGVAVIFGTPGLFKVFDAYKVLNEKIEKSQKPIYPILPSISEAAEEIKYFQNFGRQSFHDEVLFGKALAKVYNTPAPVPENITMPSNIDKEKIRRIIDNAPDGYLNPEDTGALLDAVGIPRIKEITVFDMQNLDNAIKQIDFPLVMKIIGPVHKSDVGGVKLNITSYEEALETYRQMTKIKGFKGVLLQQMAKGTELFVGAKREDKFGHLVMAGLGGIFIEILKDVSSALAPVDFSEAVQMIKKLKGYKIFKGIRGGNPINENKFAEIITRVGALVHYADAIFEMDINPLLAEEDKIIAVDARIRIEKN